MIDLSVVMGTVIAALLAVIVFKVWPMVRAFLPPVVLAIIQWIARAVVDGVESDYAGYEGEAKRQAAFHRIESALRPLLEYMKKHGYTISPERIYEAIEAAWRVMNTEQLLTGEKELPREEPEEEPDDKGETEYE